MQPIVCTRKHCSAFQRRKQSSACPFQEGTRPEPTPFSPQKHAQRQMPRPNAVIALGAQADTPQAPEISYETSYEISYHDVDKPCLCLCSPSQVVFPDLGLGSASTMSMTLQLRAASSRPQYCTTAPPSTTAVHWKCCTAFAVAPTSILNSHAGAAAIPMLHIARVLSTLATTGAACAGTSADRL